MNEEDKASELINRLKKLEHTIARLEKESKMGLEDQLFFGLVISLLVFFLALPLDDVVFLFQNNVGLNNVTAQKTAEGIRNVGLLSLIVASATRYYAALGGEKISKRFRLYSLQCLFMGWNFVLLLLIVNVSLSVSLNLGPLNFPIAGAILVATYFSIRLLEKKALTFYASKEFILKKDAAPYVSNAFLLLAGSFNLAFLVEYLVIILGMNPSVELFFLSWGLIPVLVVSLQYLVKRTRTSRTRKVNPH